MLKRLYSLLIILQFLSGTAYAGKTVFVDGNAATRSPGTRLTAATLNGLQNHRHDGKDQDGSGILDYAVDTGTTNALAIALTPPLTAHVEGMPIYLKIGHDNTGAATVTVNGLAPVEIVHRDGSSLLAGDLLGTQIIGIVYNGSKYQLTMYEPPLVTNALTVGGQSATQLAPPGAIMAFAMPNCPSGWTATDGHAESRTGKPGLFAAINTIWGSGDYSTTFNVPDSRGQFFRGWSNDGTIDAGRVFASAQADDLKAHTHTTQAFATVIYGASGGYGVAVPMGSTDTGSTGGAETRPKNIAVQYCIKY